MAQEIRPLSFSSEFGIVNPGEKCVVVTTGYSHFVNMRLATYIGVNKHGNVVVQVPREVHRWVDKTTRQPVTPTTTWPSQAERDRLNIIYARVQDGVRNSHLQLNRIAPYKEQE